MTTLQEPGFNSHGGIVTHVNWITIHAPWSESDEHARPRAISYVNKELLRCAEVVEVPTQTDRDIVIVNINGTRIINLYHQPNDPAFPRAFDRLRGFWEGETRLTSTIIAGDYNMHHPMWNSTKGPEEYAEDALGWMLDMNLTLASPPDVPTHERGGVIDLVFATTDIIDQVTMEDGVTDYLSDHFLQRWTVGDETSTELMHDSTRSYAKMDWEKFEGYIKTAAQTLRGRNLSTPHQMDKLTEELEFILQNAIN